MKAQQYAKTSPDGKTIYEVVILEDFTFADRLKILFLRKNGSIVLKREFRK